MKQLGIFMQSPVDESSSIPKVGDYWKLFVDGASRSNPGPAGAGIFIMKNDHVVEQVGFSLGIKTNNQAEYLALLIGLVYIRQRMTKDDLLLIVSDSQLLIRQLKGMYKVRHDGLKHLHHAATVLLRDVRYDAEHVMREDNARADELANEGIDKKHAVPQAISQELLRYGVTI